MRENESYEKNYMYQGWSKLMLMHDSLGLKNDWFGYNNFLSKRKLNKNSQYFFEYFVAYC